MSVGCEMNILCEGFDKKVCKVHTRGAVHGNEYLLTCQYLNIEGDDDFECLHTNYSNDGGRTWTDFRPDKAFASRILDNVRSVPTDMTPTYHKKTGKFIITGHIVSYNVGENHPIWTPYRRTTPYAVFDKESGTFGEVKTIQMPDDSKYFSCSSGCGQIYELENGELLIPISFFETGATKAKAAVMHCSFDGEEIKVLSISNDLEVKETVRGIFEISIAYSDGLYFLTIRDDDYGWISVSADGKSFTQPEKLKWTDGEIVPTYNTQAHWFNLKDRLYLVYTRKNGTNDHVFRHRAPLYAAEFDTKKLALKKETELIVVPERGARLGNFGACNIDENTALVIASEWMQPIGCEKYGSNNAVWLTTVFDK